MTAPPVPTPPPPAHDAIRRLQIGIAGVLTVLLLVGMAGLIGDRARENAGQDPASAAQDAATGGTAKAGSAPLEELGVQPVSKDQNAGGDVKTPQAAPSSVPDLEPDPALARARQTK